MVNKLEKTVNEMKPYLVTAEVYKGDSFFSVVTHDYIDMSYWEPKTKYCYAATRTEAMEELLLEIQFSKVRNLTAKKIARIPCKEQNKEEIEKPDKQRGNIKAFDVTGEIKESCEMDGCPGYPSSTDTQAVFARDWRQAGDLYRSYYLGRNGSCYGTRVKRAPDVEFKPFMDYAKRKPENY